ncbi:sodium/hydrogen exchanger 1 [Lepeophtheirus salmonis]|uniref:sodium/hydrogen exchanger 1 n=1 Tax=Lepeophtheirus salmonis TaxID=72036 RepID=UPI001AE6D013|nr:sodium/hydrogen exchanger 1-like [Lepeophtheirus salmonis]
MYLMKNFLFLLFITLYGISASAERNASSNVTEKISEHHGIRLASWRWDEYSSTILFNLMIILAATFKIAFHQIPYLPKYIPESCVLIILGCLAGVIIKYCVHFSETHPFPTFTSDLFFNVLLPPVILDAAYSLYDREFVSNLGSVMIFAIIGTLFNIFIVGGLLRGIFMVGLMGRTQELSLLECLTFASLISAVDPVAVLAIFEEIGVNLGLYFLVFGESLLNDGVTIVIYNTVTALDEKGSHVVGLDYVLAFLSFFTVAGGGFLIGIIFGILSAILLKFTQNSRVIEPIVVISVAYFAFVLAETFHWSGIMALIGCGIVQKRYAFPNASNSTRNTVKHGIRTLSSVSDAIIFLFLGTVVISKKHDFQIYFILWTLLLCFVIRFMGVFLLSWIINMIKTKPISLREQFIMAYGGLRGAVGFSLAALISDQKPYKDMVITTTIIVIFFTVFLQGSTIKLFVNLLHIKRKNDKNESHSDVINVKLVDQVMGGIEAITGNVSKYRIINLLEYIDTHYIKKFLLSHNSLINMEHKLRDISMDEHYARLYGPTVLASNSKFGTICKEDTGLINLKHSYSNEYLINNLEDQERKMSCQSLEKIFEDSPFELYKRRFCRRDVNFDDHVLKQLDSSKRTAARIKRRIMEDEAKKKFFGSDYKELNYSKVCWKDLESKTTAVDCIKREYHNTKKRIKNIRMKTE